MFQDTFFGSDESVEEYENDPDSPESVREDPLRPGRTQDPAILDPRLYYLDVVLVRVGLIKGEWRHLIDELSMRVGEPVSLQFLRRRLNIPTWFCSGMIEQVSKQMPGLGHYALGVY